MAIGALGVAIFNSEEVIYCGGNMSAREIDRREAMRLQRNRPQRETLMTA